MKVTIAAIAATAVIIILVFSIAAVASPGKQDKYGCHRCTSSCEKYELLKESLSYFSNLEQRGKPDEKELRKLYASKNWENLNEAIKSGADLLLDVRQF